MRRNELRTLISVFPVFPVFFNPYHDASVTTAQIGGAVFVGLFQYLAYDANGLKRCSHGRHGSHGSQGNKSAHHTPLGERGPATHANTTQRSADPLTLVA